MTAASRSILLPSATPKELQALTRFAESCLPRWGSLGRNPQRVAPTYYAEAPEAAVPVRQLAAVACMRVLVKKDLRLEGAAIRFLLRLTAADAAIWKHIAGDRYPVRRHRRPIRGMAPLGHTEFAWVKIGRCERDMAWVVAHELRHLWQNRNWPTEVTDLECEDDADAYAASALERFWPIINRKLEDLCPT